MINKFYEYNIIVIFFRHKFYKCKAKKCILKMVKKITFYNVKIKRKISFLNW